MENVRTNPQTEEAKDEGVAQEAAPEKWHAHEALMAADGNMEKIERVVDKPISPHVRAKLLAALREQYLAKVAPEEVLGQEMLDLVDRLDRMRPGYRESLCRELRKRAGEPLQPEAEEPAEASDIEESEPTVEDEVTTTGIKALDEMIGSMCIADHADDLGCMRLAAMDPDLGKRIEAVVANEIDTTLARGDLDYEGDTPPNLRRGEDSHCP